MSKYVTLVFLFLAATSKAHLNNDTLFTRADTLRGMLTPLRTCYDVNFYHLDIKALVSEQRIVGSNLFRFTAVQPFKKLQFDLFENLKIEKIIYKGIALPFRREYNAVIVEFPVIFEKGASDEFKVHYSGAPLVAKDPPWDGGFVYSKDTAGKPWVGVACQELGASAWWPNKDHQSDEPDSMLISVTVPSGLMNVSNGRLRSVEKKNDGFVQYNWFVSSPINNYNVTLNVGDYANFSDGYTGELGLLSLDYYVLRENLEKAKSHFPGDVKAMLKAFEYYFGPYPFYKDGFKLVETPYLGMEHQSAIAYGNNYKKGYRGSDLSGTGLGANWDYIIIHEAGHEWFGNNITSRDIADLWIHESFTTYAEGLFVEWLKGKNAGAEYLKGLRKNIQNHTPIIGFHNVNKPGSDDMYAKGANMLHTIRSIINDDDKWRKILRGLNQTFGMKTTSHNDIVGYINKESGLNLTSIFDQYLRHPQIPILEINKEGANKLRYRWKTNIPNFEMPVRAKLGNSMQWEVINPTSNWQLLRTKSITVDTTNFYIRESFVNKLH